MFSANLSTSLLRLCDLYELSYEQASERCGCSARHFGNIVRMKSVPSLYLFEQMCIGFGTTPNQLLGISPAPLEVEPFRVPMPVTQLVRLKWDSVGSSFPVCPRCHISMEREFQPFCDHCGQCLSWRDLKNASFIQHP